MNEVRQPVQVVVAYDFSPTAEEALARAVDVAARAPHHILHIVAALEAHGGLGGSLLHHTDYQTAERVQLELTARASAAFAGRATAAEIQFYVHARIGKPADQVLAVARDVSADLIFIGSHGKTGVERLLLGSVSERVVREAQCPVMVVRPKTYDAVDLLHVVRYEHERAPFTPPHRYSYVDKRVITRPNDWPLF
ncbi:MAG: universal stress protein [Myxococcota bacterium]|nr:universal stress protein [Myxococcota bacterium]